MHSKFGLFISSSLAQPSSVTVTSQSSQMPFLVESIQGAPPPGPIEASFAWRTTSPQLSSFRFTPQRLPVTISTQSFGPLYTGFPQLQTPSKEKPRQNSRNPQVRLSVDDKTSNVARFYFGHLPVLLHFHLSIRPATSRFFIQLTVLYCFVLDYGL